MEYTVQKLAKLAGVSARTLRFYDEIDLLKPARISSNGYRIYGAKEVDLLQQILFLRALGLELSAIAALLQDPGYNRLSTLRAHLAALQTKKAELDLLIDSVRKTIETEEGIRTMTDNEKFAAFKAKLIDDNETQYGAEVRERYGDDAVDQSNKKMLGMSQAQYDQMQALAQTILEKVGQAVRENAPPDGETGREITALHRQWLTFTWTHYTPQAHMGLAQMYVDDPRFTAYYDEAQPGSAAFVRDAVHAWAEKL